MLSQDLQRPEVDINDATNVSKSLMKELVVENRNIFDITKVIIPCAALITSSRQDFRRSPPPDAPTGHQLATVLFWNIIRSIRKTNPI